MQELHYHDVYRCRSYVKGIGTRKFVGVRWKRALILRLGNGPLRSLVIYSLRLDFEFVSQRA